MVAYSFKGERVWHHDFPKFSGAPPEWNNGGLTMWFLGRFTDPRRDDVLVTLRRGMMHSDEAHLIDGRAGREVWTRTQGGTGAFGKYPRGCGGALMAVFDYNGDGLDDAMSMYPDTLYVMSGPDGRLLLDRCPDLLFGDWAFSGQPAIYDVRRLGAPEIIFGASQSFFALLTREADIVWVEGPGKGSIGVVPGIGDVDGDGQIELLTPGRWGGADDCALIGELNRGTPYAIRCHAAAALDARPVLPSNTATSRQSPSLIADSCGR